jgi:magnesium chelatase subunit I
MIANATRRALQQGETDVVAGGCGHEARGGSTPRQVEIESLEEGREEQILDHLVRSAVLTVFRDRVPQDGMRAVVDAFDDGRIVAAGDDIGSADYVTLLNDLPALREPVRGLTGDDESPAAVAAAVEFVLDGLHLSKRLNKEASGARALYRSRG